MRFITHGVNIPGVFSADFQRGAHSEQFEDLNSSTSSVPRDMTSGTSGDSMIDNLRMLLEQAEVEENERMESTEMNDIIIAHLRQSVKMPYDNFTSWINDVELKSGLDLGAFKGTYYLRPLQSSHIDR